MSFLKSKSNCYLANIYTDKYKDETFYLNDLYGTKTQRKFYFKLPPIIEPYQEIILSELDNNLRVE